MDRDENARAVSPRAFHGSGQTSRVGSGRFGSDLTRPARISRRLEPTRPGPRDFKTYSSDPTRPATLRVTR